MSKCLRPMYVEQSDSPAKRPGLNVVARQCFWQLMLSTLDVIKVDIVDIKNFKNWCLKH